MTARYGLVVIGGGTAGLVAAVGAAGVGARVALIERDRTGGECLWTGCVPSKSLIAAADLAHRMRDAAAVGLDPVEPHVDFERVMARVHAARERLAPHDSPERLREEGVEVIHGHARFAGPGRVMVGDRILHYRRALVATGSSPVVPPVEGIDRSGALTSDDVWDLEELPSRLVVLGGGPTGCELGQAFARLGARVTIVEMTDRLLRREDPEASRLVAERLRSEGIDVRLGARATRIDHDGGEQRLEIRQDGEVGAVAFDRLLVAVGRRADVDGLDLDTVGVETAGDGSVVVDGTMRTTGRGIYAAGDVTGGPPFTHVAAYQAGLVVTNALFHLRRKASYANIPWVTFTDPEVGRVGRTEKKARARWGAGAIVRRFDCAELDRAVCAGQAYGFVKLVADPRGRLVGATVAAPWGGETIAGIASFMRHGATISDVSQTVLPYPTFSEGARRAAIEHLRDKWLSERVRRVTRPVLHVLRAIERP
ncbi:MAG: FAD-dependent oxidoreductase [Actinobacteria bacterium]|nr:FAD-dependent oxidoreductase [Actinomycetota bacterium]